MLKRKIIPFFIILGLFVPVLGSAQEILGPPKDFEEAKELGGEALDTTKEELPGAIERTWNEDIVPTWKNMYHTVAGWSKSIWLKVKSIFSKEVEKRKPQIKEEFEKEKEEIKEEIKAEGERVGKSLWEKFKDLIR